jgi:hypothetical protein
VSRVAVTSAATLLMSTPATWATEPAPPEQVTPVVGDANRDGRDDLLLVRSVGSGIRVLVDRSTGASFTRTWFGGVLEVPFAGTGFAAPDLNRDGRADLVPFVDLGDDAGGAALGATLWRLYSSGTAYSGAAWLTDVALVAGTYTAH